MFLTRRPKNIGSKMYKIMDRNSIFRYFEPPECLHSERTFTRGHIIGRTLVTCTAVPVCAFSAIRSCEDRSFFCAARTKTANNVTGSNLVRPSRFQDGANNTFQKGCFTPKKQY